jgi:hypothetical protein
MVYEKNLYYDRSMKNEEKPEECCQGKMNFKHHHCHKHGGDSSAIYGLGVVGALFYFLQHASTFGEVMVGIGKSIFWPAVLLFKVLTNLQM